MLWKRKKKILHFLQLWCVLTTLPCILPSFYSLSFSTWLHMITFRYIRLTFPSTHKTHTIYSPNSFKNLHSCQNGEKPISVLLLTYCKGAIVTLDEPRSFDFNNSSVRISYTGVWVCDPTHISLGILFWKNEEWSWWRRRWGIVPSCQVPVMKGGGNSGVCYLVCVCVIGGFVVYSWKLLGTGILVTCFLVMINK